MRTAYNVYAAVGGGADGLGQTLVPALGGSWLGGVVLGFAGLGRVIGPT